MKTVNKYVRLLREVVKPPTLEILTYSHSPEYIVGGPT